MINHLSARLSRIGFGHAYGAASTRATQSMTRPHKHGVDQARPTAIGDGVVKTNVYQGRDIE